MKIKVKLFNTECKFETFSKGDFIDLRAAEDVNLEGPFANVLTNKRTRRTVEFNTACIPLGIGMKIPNGYEAIIIPRSSSLSTFGFIQANSVGLIDGGTYGYCGPNDQWKLPIIAINDVHINKGERICQFKIQLSQKATMWQKIKWLFNSKIKFKFVNDYKGVDRNGFGSTGV